VNLVRDLTWMLEGKIMQAQLSRCNVQRRRTAHAFKNQ
jgi:hypothetical protein